MNLCRKLPAALGVLAVAMFAPEAAEAQTAGRVACTAFGDAAQRLESIYGREAAPFASPELAAANSEAEAAAPSRRLDRALMRTALGSYYLHHCRGRSGFGSGPAQVIIVDFAKPSSEPRLYAVDLRNGSGLDTPIQVAHGIGSDPDDNGIADRFSNVYNSLASSLGAARGAELYHGANGLSLRLDGLDPSNSMMRTRDIVAHSYAPYRRRYFNASYLGDRSGKPGTSEGCFVVAPEYRDWLFGILGNGGFLFAGLGGSRASEMLANIPAPRPSAGEVVFVRGTGG